MYVTLNWHELPWALLQKILTEKSTNINRWWSSLIQYYFYLLFTGWYILAMVNKSYSPSLFTMAETTKLVNVLSSARSAICGEYSRWRWAPQSLSKWIDNPVRQVSASVIVTCNLCEYRGSKQRPYNCKDISRRNISFLLNILVKYELWRDDYFSTGIIGGTIHGSWSTCFSTQLVSINSPTYSNLFLVTFMSITTRAWPQ